MSAGKPVRYAVYHGLDAEVAWQLTSMTFTAIVVSIVLHGITVTPLMNWRHARRPLGSPTRNFVISLARAFGGALIKKSVWRP